MPKTHTIITIHNTSHPLRIWEQWKDKTRVDLFCLYIMMRGVIEAIVVVAIFDTLAKSPIFTDR